MSDKVPPPSLRAFTMLELLCALAIIGLLAALLVPAAQKIRAAADNAGCVSNLRQIGLGIANYCNDHDGTLPGPVFSSVTSTYTLPNIYLTGYLAEYLGGQTSSTTPQVLPLALCPAYKRVVPTSTWPQGFSYYSLYCLMKDASTPTYDGGGRLISPWGRTGGAPLNAAQINSTPMKLTALAGWCDPSKTWAVQDADGKNYGSGAAVGQGVALSPVHGSHWNQLYFDFHVAAVPIQPH
jgi:prepilin-type N-terminal cleavage/methylation domain-containing protein